MYKVHRAWSYMAGNRQHAGFWNRGFTDAVHFFGGNAVNGGAALNRTQRFDIGAAYIQAVTGWIAAQAGDGAPSQWQCR